MRLIPLLLLFACGSTVEDTASHCPPATDPCMDADLYQECLDIEATCDGGLLIMESCPLQFGCAE
ncbi:MAG: hypothetical protein EP330_20420 [Deltaproteobacteria bacterium]|nr:MAG: hypothetical protein EP330_20420 [Deltaproteobacteria bacterium]